MENHHAHCMNCISRRCMTRPEAGVSCDLASCALVCGAVFHGCKADEHRLLCPLERVPCLNSGFGCPFTVTRGKMSEHLAVCPASVVCCTMEWNRWPISDADRTSYENLSRDVDEVEQLDMALALQDQRMLLESLKVATMLSKNGDNPPGGEKTCGPAAPPPPPPGCRNEKIANGINGLDEESYSELYQATVETSRTLVAALDILSSATKEMDTLNGGVPADGRGEPNGGFHGGAEAEVPGSGNVDMKGSDSESDCELGAVGGMDLEAAAGDDEDAPDGGKTWTKRNGFLEPENGAEEEEDGVFGLLERDEKPLCNGFHSPGDEPDQMDLEVAGERRPETNGSWEVFRPANGAEALLNRSVAVAEQRPSCSQPPPRLPLPLPIPLHDIVPNGGAYPLDLEDRWLERKLQNLQALRAMGSFAFSGRRALYADSLRVKMEDKSVDTSDLEVADDPMGLHGIDLITAALLFCLGDSPGGRGISDSRFVDGYRIDLGTQTFSFPSAILATNTMVGDVASASACDHASPQLSNPSPFHTLRLDLVLQCVARYQTKQRSMFTFVCGQLFRRDEFSSHFKNVHCDIHAGLNGWMEHRCPLAYYGCTYSQRRFCPSTQGYRIIHDRHLRSFGVRPRGSAPPPPPSPSPSPSPGGPPLPGNACRFGTDCDHLSGLPFELLQHVAGFLDGFSLCQLSRVSRMMRDVCASLLQARGMVVLLWEKRRYPSGPSSWQIKDKVWRFSTAFGTVNEWKFANITSMADHLKKCKFNTVERREEAVPLPCMCFTRELTKEGRSLRSVLKPVL
ncbi:F-box only protein 30-like [Anguilla anguilla]|uniref:F-box only protein 30-like n=1 Tax=Anguilla anguilla TaxID=7936 RepID=UPI0015AC5424|nr:F-box only protein 30-like [Anguilla anguilla]XP_035278280.1 F-box only protein 30-like [Anguilla anguilla]